MTARVSVDRAAVRRLVEDHWRDFLSRMQRDPWSARNAILEFQARIEAEAARMPQEQADAFLAVVEQERERLGAEYDAQADDLKRRLGVAPAPQRHPGTQRMGLGEVAVRTAVRATVWEIVISLFRLLR